MPIGIKWLLRILLLAAALFLALRAEKELVERVANATSAIFTIGAFYVATVEPEWLGWIIERAQRFYRRRKGKSRRSKFRAEGRSPVKAQSVVGEPAHSDSTSSNLENPKLQASFGADQLGVPDEPKRLLGIIGASVFTLYAVAFLVTSLISRSGTNNPPHTGEVVVQLPAEPERSNPPFDAIPVTETPTQTENYVRVQYGDTCFAIAEACTGNGERFVELGAPVNEWLDVSNRRFCLIHPNDEIIIPDTWPSTCRTEAR